MAFPTGWPPRAASGTRSIRFYQEGTTTSFFKDNAYIFAQQSQANPYVPLPYVAPGSRDTVVLGDTLVTGSPQGSGRDKGNGDPLGVTVPAPQPMIWCRAFVIHALTGDIEFSFDGVNVHGFVPSGEEVMYFDRYEAGICVRGPSGVADFVIEAW